MLHTQNMTRIQATIYRAAYDDNAEENTASSMGYGANVVQEQMELSNAL